MKDEIDGKIAHMPKELLGIVFRLIMNDLLIDFFGYKQNNQKGNGGYK